MSAILLQNGKQAFTDANGRPLAGGRVYFYVPATSTPKDTWQDAAQTILNTNPIILDARGEASIYGAGSYRQVLRDASLVQIWDAYIPDLAGALQASIDDLMSKSQVQVDNIAALRLLSKLVYKNAATAGYYLKGDGGAGTYYYDAADTTSVDDGGAIIVAADGGRWKLIYDGEINVKQYGAKCDGVFDDSLRIQAAINYGKPLYAPEGTSLMTLSQNITLEGGPSVCALIAKNEIKVRGAGMGKTIWKIKDNQSTDASPKYFNLMAGNTVIAHMDISGITFDLNGQNNKISPNRGTGVYSTANTAGIFISGRASVVGVDARLLASKIYNCEFLNGPGVTCIATGQQEASAVMSDGVEIYGCRFFNNGIDSQDHSSVYMWGNNINVHDCLFDHPTLSSGTQGPVVGAELHGSENFFTNNTVNNYAQGVWISGNQTTPSRGITVADNSFAVSWVGVGFFSINPISLGLTDINITNNRIWIQPKVLTNPGLTFAKTGLLLTMTNGECDRLLVEGNNIRCTDTAANIGILVSANSGAFVVDALLEGNQVSGFSRGIAVGLGATGAVFDINIKSNNICNMTPSTALANTQGIHVSGALGKISISGNEISGSATHPNQCIYLGTFGGPATLDSLYMANNSLDANAVSGIVDAMIVAGQRAGLQATTFAALPTQSTWKVGDIATSATKPRAGTAPNQYKMVGWVRETNGTANVINVDWFEQRIPCGV